jgi:hypothetical protein
MGKDPNEIRHQIERTRARLGETVDAIAYKTDVKSRFREKLTEKLGSAEDVVREGLANVKAAAGESAQRAVNVAEAAKAVTRNRNPGPSRTDT